MDQVFEKADDAAGDEEDEAAKSQITDRSQSFVGETLKEMNKQATALKNQSSRHAQAIESGDPGDGQNFSLLLCPEWEKAGSQIFVDLANLVKCGIPAALRTAAWGDFVRVSLIRIEEKKNLMRNFSQFSNQSGSQISQSQNKSNIRKDVSPF